MIDSEETFDAENEMLSIETIDQNRRREKFLTYRKNETVFSEFIKNLQGDKPLETIKENEIFQLLIEIFRKENTLDFYVQYFWSEDIKAILIATLFDYFIMTENEIDAMKLANIYLPQARKFKQRSKFGDDYTSAYKETLSKRWDMSDDECLLQILVKNGKFESAKLLLKIAIEEYERTKKRLFTTKNTQFFIDIFNKEKYEEAEDFINLLYSHLNEGSKEVLSVIILQLPYPRKGTEWLIRKNNHPTSLLICLIKYANKMNPTSSALKLLKEKGADFSVEYEKKSILELFLERILERDMDRNTDKEYIKNTSKIIADLQTESKGTKYLSSSMSALLKNMRDASTQTDDKVMNDTAAPK